MANENTPVGTMTGANHAVEHGLVLDSDNISLPGTAELEIKFLHALLDLPAARLLTVVDGLDRDDIYHPHHQVVLDAIVCCARIQTEAGDGNRPVDPIIVQLDLTRTRDLDHADVRAALLRLTAGTTPASAYWIAHLVAELRVNRLRCACLTMGEALTQAGRTGGYQDLARALSYLPRLLDLARRAGLNLKEMDR